jgi:hypothetical protein
VRARAHRFAAAHVRGGGFAVIGVGTLRYERFAPMMCR